MSHSSGQFAGIIEKSQTIYIGFVTKNTSGVPTAPTTTPTFEVFNAILSGTIASGSATQVGSITGMYRMSYAVTGGGADGIAKGKSYVIRSSYTVGANANSDEFHFSVI